MVYKGREYGKLAYLIPFRAHHKGHQATFSERGKGEAVQWLSTIQDKEQSKKSPSDFSTGSGIYPWMIVQELVFQILTMRDLL